MFEQPESLELLLAVGLQSLIRFVLREYCLMLALQMWGTLQIFWLRGWHTASAHLFHALLAAVGTRMQWAYNDFVIRTYWVWLRPECTCVMVPPDDAQTFPDSECAVVVPFSFCISTTDWLYWYSLTSRTRFWMDLLCWNLHQQTHQPQSSEISWTQDERWWLDCCLTLPSYRYTAGSRGGEKHIGICNQTSGGFRALIPSIHELLFIVCQVCHVTP